MSQQMGGSWRDLVAGARQRAKQVSDDPRTKQALAKAAAGAGTASKHLDATRRKLTQEEAWAETTMAIEELVQVVVVQQELLEDLLERVSSVERERTARAFDDH